MEADATMGLFHQIGLPARDLERSISFYRDDLGLRLIASFDPPGLAFFDLGGGVRLLLERSREMRSGSSVLYIRVQDIRRAHERLAGRGVSFSSDPHLIHRDDAGTFGEPGAEEWMAFFSDPDGNHLALAWRGVGPPGV
jgi:methylmalonyl-CoA/ethylmalonyl-CoA epimerase